MGSDITRGGQTSTDITSAMDVALRNIRGNLERLLDKNLTDLVRGIRNNKENEVCWPLEIFCRQYWVLYTLYVFA